MANEEEVKQIVKLAHLTVTDSDLPKLTKDFNSILNYVGQLESIDVSEVVPMSHAHGATNIFREDVVTPLLTTEEALINAPDRSGNFVRVPLVIEDE